MEYDIDFNLKELVGKNAWEAYLTYCKLTEYSTLFANDGDDVVICDDYSSRDYNYPMGLCVKEI
jgi:hypothetical protein